MHWVRRLNQSRSKDKESSQEVVLKHASIISIKSNGSEGLFQRLVLDIHLIEKTLSLEKYKP